MPLVDLAEGLQVWSPNVFDALALYQDIFASRCYLQHGITVADGDCVLDVGANVGLFSIFLARSYRRLRLFLFEPVPPLFELLERNASHYLTEPNLRLCRYGLAAAPGQAEFQFERFGSMTATMRPADVTAAIRREASLRDWLLAAVHDFARVGWLSPTTVQWVVRSLAVPGLRLLLLGCFRLLLMWFVIRQRLFLRRMTCPLRTISAVIAEYELATVDLLKIDVEGSELEVLRGIAPADWLRIRQLVIEVHDADGRLATITDLLQEQGYRTSVEREKWAACELLGLSMIYAVRESNADVSAGIYLTPR
jgi:31-O-methyltransferase